MFSDFFGYVIDPDRAVRLFTWHHAMHIGLAVVAIVLPLKFADAIRKSRHEKRVVAGFFWFLVALEMIYHAHNWLGGYPSYPLHICSFGVFLSLTLIKTNHTKVFEYAFFFAVLGGFMAMFIPFGYGFPYTNIRYYHFILIHMTIIMVPLYFYKAYDHRVDLHTTFKVFLVTLLMMPVMNQINLGIMNISDNAFHNYWFVTEIPEHVAPMFTSRVTYVLTLCTLVFVAMMVLYRVSNRGRIERRKRATA